MNILFLQIGGTIDKCYPAGENDHGYSFEIGAPAFVPIMNRIKPPYSWSGEELLKKDSTDMTPADRNSIHQYICRSEEGKIILTHGTDTIHRTAEILSDIEGKTIVLTGAMQPEKFKDSDADFNLGMAVAAVQCLPPGVYIALHGIVVPWDEYISPS